MGKKISLLERRQAIIQAAEMLFNRYGYEKTTLDDIAKAVGITRSLIYLEFPSKEDVLFATVESIVKQNLTEMRQIARDSTQSKLETLKQLILYNILFAYDKSSQYFCAITLRTLHQRIREQMGPLLAEKQQVFYQLLQEAVDAHELPDHSHYSKIAELLLEVLTCFMPPNNLKYTREQIQQDASLLFDVILSGLTVSNLGENTVY